MTSPSTNPLEWSNLIHRRVGNKVCFEADASRLPTHEEINERQAEELGYHPAGYGGPMDVTIVVRQEGPGAFVRWYCWGSAD